MCSRGIYQLKQLQIFLCDYGGSSAALREIAPKVLENQILKSSPVDIKIEFVRGLHPYVKAQYVNGYTKQICLKQVKEEEDLLNRLLFLRNSFGQQSLRHAGRKVHTVSPSIQGKWNENLFPNYPQHEMEIQRSFPKVEVEAPTQVPCFTPKEENKRTRDLYDQFFKPQLGGKVKD